MDSNEGPEPCGICGWHVYEELVEGQMSITDVRPPVEVQRVCQNPECPSNTGQMSFTQAV